MNFKEGKIFKVFIGNYQINFREEEDWNNFIDNEYVISSIYGYYKKYNIIHINEWNSLFLKFIQNKLKEAYNAKEYIDLKQIKNFDLKRIVSIFRDSKLNFIVYNKNDIVYFKNQNYCMYFKDDTFLANHISSNWNALLLNINNIYKNDKKEAFNRFNELVKIDNEKRIFDIDIHII